MAREPFLINPVRRKKLVRKRRKKVSSPFKSFKFSKKTANPCKFLSHAGKKRVKRVNPKRRSKHKGLPGALLKRMIKEHGLKRGMSEAWKEFRQGARNPVGEEVFIMGANPKRKRRRHHVKHNAPKRIHHRRRLSMKHNDPGRKRVHHRRRHRSNPVGAMAMKGSIDVRKPGSLVMPIAMILGAQIATVKIPAMIGLTGVLPKYGIKLAIAIGGGMLISRFAGKTNGGLWMASGLAATVADALNTYVLKGLIPGGSEVQAITTSSVPAVSGYPGADEPYDIGAFPYEGVGAFPY